MEEYSEKYTDDLNIPSLDSMEDISTDLNEFDEDIFPEVESLSDKNADLQSDVADEIPEDFSIEINSVSTQSQDWERTSLSPNEESFIHEMEKNGEIDVFEVDPNCPEPSHSELHLPDASGRFLGERGNSEFKPYKDSALDKMLEYGHETVQYKNGYPDFSPFTTHRSPWGDLSCQVEIGHMTDQRENPSWEFGDRPRGAGHDPQYDIGNFAQADNSLIERVQQEYPDATVQDIVSFRKENQLTWHECADGKTMQLVPTEIHDACRHSGGVSEMKYRMAYGNVEMPGLED